MKPPTPLSPVEAQLHGGPGAQQGEGRRQHCSSTGSAEAAAHSGTQRHRAAAAHPVMRTLLAAAAHRPWWPCLLAATGETRRLPVKRILQQGGGGQLGGGWVCCAAAVAAAAAWWEQRRAALLPLLRDPLEGHKVGVDGLRRKHGRMGQGSAGGHGGGDWLASSSTTAALPPQACAPRPQCRRSQPRCCGPSSWPQTPCRCLRGVAVRVGS